MKKFDEFMHKKFQVFLISDSTDSSRFSTPVRAYLKMNKF